MPDHVDNAAVQAQSIDKNATFKSELKSIYPLGFLFIFTANKT